MTAGLILVDVQEDFLRRTPLYPSRPQVEGRLALLLALFRERGLPIIHVQTRVAADGSDAMAHWRQTGRHDCRAGSAGAEPPPALAPLAGETVVPKRHFNPFGHTELEAVLRQRNVRRVFIAGLYTHACVREAVLGAYELGLEVTVVADAVAATEALHAEITRQYLTQRACRFIPLDELFAPPEACFALERRAETLAAQARLAGAAWADSAADERVALLSRWRELLLAEQEALLRTVAEEVVKPPALVAEEFNRALAHLEGAIALALAPEERLADQVRVRYRALGCIAVITPWNNPLAIAIGKLAPALAHGNAVVWKPAPEAAASSRQLLATLQRALTEQGQPLALVSCLEGGAAAGEALMRTPGIAAVTLTGSMSTGALAQAICQTRGIPLQAELGGNNAAIVWHGADLADAARQLMSAAYGYAGQRCTAIRRLIVAQALLPDFIEHFRAACRDFLAGGGAVALINPQRRARMEQVIAEALAQGAQWVFGGTPATPSPDADRPWIPACAGMTTEGNSCAGQAADHGVWCSTAETDALPTLLLAGPDNPVFQEESFAPIAVLTPAAAWSEALALADGVAHGLVAVLFGGGPQEQEDFQQHIQAGMVHLGACHGLLPQAPFVGWKGSALGPPEHGRWDREFHAQPQTLYGPGADIPAQTGLPPRDVLGHLRSIV